MKQLLILILSFSFSGVFAQVTKTVNASASSLKWIGYKVTGSHEGTIGLESGTLQFDDNGILTGGSFVIDMSSIDVTDMDADMNKKLEGHLKSEDFFGVENYPKARLEITKAVSRGNGKEYKIDGNLTIKETTAPVKFIATVMGENAEAKIEVDRSVYNVRYGSGSFFDNLGDKTIYDIFELYVDLKM